MKRILIACFLLTAAASVAPTQHVAAYSAAAPVTVASFTAKVNLMDSQIGAGSMTAAQATWEEIHTMMLSVLGVTKNSILTAPTPAAKTAYETILNNQTVIYQAAWNLKPNLATNRALIKAKLLEFAATIY